MIRLWVLLFCFSFIFGVATAHAETIPAAYTLSAPDVEAAVSKALTENGLGERVKAELTGLKSASLYESATPVSVRIGGLTADKATSRWHASLLVVAENGDVLTAKPISGRYQEMVELPVLKRQLRSTDTITQADITRMEFPLARTRADAATDENQLLGQSPRAAISPNRPVRLSELSMPAVLKKNALVQMRYQSAGLEIVTSGQAITQGGKGDIIEVRNLTSKQVVRAQVIDANTVTAINSTKQFAGEPNAPSF